MILDSPIATERLILRSLTREDASQKYLNWLRDKEITKYLEVRFSPPKNLIELEKYIQDISKNNCDLLLGIFLQDDICTHIVNIKIGPIVKIHRRAEIGIMIGDKHSWGHGYASESICAITQYIFEKFGLHQIMAGLYNRNVGSYKAFLKSGYLEEARLKDYWLCDGSFQDQILMYKLYEGCHG